VAPREKGVILVANFEMTENKNLPAKDKRPGNVSIRSQALVCALDMNI